jgi:hypothetical protein
MQKTIPLLIFLLITEFGISQSICPPNGITTDSANPTNPNQTNYLNHFDWTTDSPYYNINSQCNPNTFTSNPFQSNQLELLPLSLSKDMKPIDGWEMIAYNLGFDNNNSPLASRPEHTYVMLYNKYSGTLRILVKWCRNSNYNGALMTLKFAPGFQTNLLDMTNNEKSLDTPHVINPSISTALKFYNDNSSWAYADFKMNYDPCTCSFGDSSRLFLYSELISNSSVELTGKMTGTITSISNGSGSTASDGVFWKTASTINSNMIKAHKGVTDFAKNYQTIYKNLNDNGVTINAINSIGNFMNSNSFLKAGLKTLPYVSEGVKFLSGLFGGGASGTQPIQLAPLSVNLDVKINGTIATADPMHNQTIGLPGSQLQNTLSGITGGQPLYNETLGVFSLINNPVMYYSENTVVNSYTDKEVKNGLGWGSNDQYTIIGSKYNFITRNYKMSDEALKYAINPASGLILQDAEVMLIAEYYKPSIEYSKLSIYNNLTPEQFLLKGLDVDLDNGLHISGTTKGPSVDLNNRIFQNAFKPIGIKNFKNNYSFSYIYEITENSYNIKTYSDAASTQGAALCRLTPSHLYAPGTLRPFSYIGRSSSSQSNCQLSFTSNSSLSSLPINAEPKPEFLTPRIKNFKLKFILNLKRSDNPNAQNVLYVVTYPVELKLAPPGYNMSGSDYIADAQTYATQAEFNPTEPTNKVIPATQTELTTLCSSSAYRTNRTSTAGKMANDLASREAIVSNILKPKLYPTPAKDLIHIVLNKCEMMSITDLSGATLNDFSSSIFDKNSDELLVDISGYRKGFYVLKYRDSEGIIKSLKFAVE